MTRWAVAKRLLRLMSPMTGLMTVSLLSRVINQGLGVAIAGVAIALVLDPARDGVGSLLLLLAVMALVKGGARYLEQFTGHSVAFRLLADLRERMFRSILSLGPSGVSQDRSGDLVARAIGDIDRVEPFYAHGIAPVTSAVVVPLLTALGLGHWVDPTLGLVFLPFPIMMAWVVPWIGARQLPAQSRLLRSRAGETSAAFSDAVQGARDLAVFDASDFVAGRIASRAEQAATIRGQMARLAAARVGVNDLLAGAAVVAVLGVGISRLEVGAIGLIGLAVATVAAWVGTAPARAIEEIGPDLEQALAAAERLYGIIERPGTSAAAANNRPEMGEITLQAVSVETDHNQQALADVGLKVGDGSHVAVVGPSGAGKSTLLELLTGLRQPDEGAVTIGGIDVCMIDPEVLAEDVTLVPQRADIFHGTIAENMRLADSEATDDEIWEALDRAALGGWVRTLPEGLATSVAELGESMSGGQRQRLALARGLLRQSRVLLLDEATSELDVETERSILAEIGSMRGARTVVMVSHRLGSTVDADLIHVLEKGRLVESGTHQDLVGSGGVYSALWKRHLDSLAG